MKLLQELKTRFKKSQILATVVTLGGRMTEQDPVKSPGELETQ